MRHFYCYLILFLFFYLSFFTQAQIVDPHFTATVKGGGQGLSISAVALQGDGKIILANVISIAFANSKPYFKNLIRLHVNGAVDENFDVGLGANASIKAIAIQSTGKIIIGGEFTAYNQRKVNYMARLHADGSLDSTFELAGFDQAVNVIRIMPDDKILVAGKFTLYHQHSRNRIARLHPDGALDSSFDPGSGADNEIYDIEVIDDQILALGFFTSFNGSPYKKLVQLHGNGVVNTNFNVGTGTSQYIKGISVHSDGKILLFGSITSFNGVARYGVIMLKRDGSIDPSFTNPLASSIVDCAVFDVNGNVVVSGVLRFLQPRGDIKLARFTSSGSFDENFNDNIGEGPFFNIHNIVFQADHSLVIAGSFNSYSNSYDSHSITRLFADGRRDNNFRHKLEPVGMVRKITLQPDGKILVGGMFNGVNGLQTYNIYRLHADGSSDLSFKPVTMLNITATKSSTSKQDYIQDIKLLSDGRILLVGSFTSINGLPYKHLARLKADGEVDLTFHMGLGAQNSLSSRVNVKSVELLASGQILVCGLFDYYHGHKRNGLARLQADGSLDLSFDVKIHEVLSESSPYQVSRIALDQHEKIILIFGRGLSGDEVFGQKILRLHSDGSLDTSFLLGVINIDDSYQTIREIGQQTDGKIILGGNFSTFNSVTSSTLIRLNANGSLDSTFQLPATYRRNLTALEVTGDSLQVATYSYQRGDIQSTLDQFDRQGKLLKSIEYKSPELVYIDAIARQANGAMIIGGSFTQLNSQLHIGLARLIPFPAPVALTVEAISPMQAKLSWVDLSTGEEGFEITRWIEKEKGYATIITTGPNTLTYQDTTVQAGVSYYYRIRSIHSTDTSAFSPEAWVAMPKMKQTISFAPIADQMLEEKAFQLLASSSSSLPLHWEVLAGSAKVEGNQLLFEDAGRVTVRASQQGNETYETAPSVERSFCVNPLLPVITIEGDSTTESFILLSSSLIGNQWLWNGEIIQGATLPSYQVDRPGRYALQVSASGGCARISAEVILTALEEKQAILWNLYPNPTSTTLEINYPSQTLTSQVHVYIYTMSGKKLALYTLEKSLGGWQAQIRVDHMPAGRYVIVLQDEGKRSIKFFTKQ